MFRFSSLAAVSAALAAAIAAAPATGAPTPDDPNPVLAASKQSPNAKIGPWLGNLYDEYREARGKGVADKLFRTTNKALRVADGRVAIDALAIDGGALARSLRSMGATKVTARGPLLSARVPVRALGRLAADPSLAYARPVMATTNALPVPARSQGVASLGITPTPAGGAGVTVGVLSDSIDCDPDAFEPGAPTSTFDEDKQTGELPANTTILSDASGECPATDEGRAMAQIVHDIAPGSSIAFHTAFDGELDFADGIQELEGAGARVIVDDASYYTEPFYSDGAIAQAVDIVVANGATYLSSAGNQARDSYESEFRGVDVLLNSGKNLNGGKAVVRRFHDFDPGPGVEILQSVTVYPDEEAGFIIFSFQWNQPFKTATTYAHLQDGRTPEQAAALAKGATSDVDMVIFDAKGHVLRLCPPGVSRGITCQLGADRNVGKDAVDLGAIYYSGPPKAPQEFFVGFVLAAGPDPGIVKYVWFEEQGEFEMLDYSEGSGTSFGHSNAAGTIAVGAASWYATVPYSTSGLVPPNDDFEKPAIAPGLAECAPACLNDFSSAGGIPIYLDRYGDPLSQPEIRQTPSVTGPDGGNTSFFYFDSSYDDDDGNGLNSPLITFVTPLDEPENEYPNFFGTSASAPHVAGLAALMLQANGSLGPDDLRNILQTTARDITLRFVSDRPIETFAIPAGTGYDFDSGFGMVNGAAALEAAGD